jgi:AcrR family transcriptional regulator
VSAPSSEGSEGSRPDLGPLPGGHHGLSREQVAESQRERLIAAVAHVSASKGYRATTIKDISGAAAVSTKAFYENFASKEACFLAAFEAVHGHLQEVIATAVAAVDDWPGQVIAALGAALDFYDAEPDLARLCLVEPVTATPVIAARFREVVVAASLPLRAGRRQRPGDAEPLPDSTEDSLLGGLVVLTSRSILASDESLPALLPDLVEFVLAPYLGPERARVLAEKAGSGDDEA